MRRTLVCRTLVGPLATALSTTAVYAQGGGRSSPADAPAQSVLRPDFQLLVGGGASYENNVRFTRVAPQDDLTRRALASLTATMRLGRTVMTLNGSGGLSSHQKFREMDQSNYDVAAGLTRALTPRMAMTAAAQASTSFTPVIDSGATALTLGPLTTIHSQSVIVGLGRELSPRTTAGFRADARRVRYSLASLAGGSEVGVNGDVRRRLGRTTGVGLQLSASRTAFAASSVLSESLSGNVSGSRGALDWGLTAGAQVVKMDTGSTPRPRLLAQGNLARRLGRFAAQVRAGYSTEPTLGVGSVLTTRFVGASVTRTSARGTSISLSVDQSASQAQTPVAAEFVTAGSGLHSLAMGLDLRQALGRNTWVAAGATMRRSGSDDLINAGVMSLSVGRQLF